MQEAMNQDALVGCSGGSDFDSVRPGNATELADPAGAGTPLEDLVISRHQLAQAIHHWGGQRQDAVRGTLTREVNILVEVLALMDFERQDTVLLPRDSQPGALVAQALQDALSRASDAAHEHCAAARG
jgi:hypothetical protein